MSVESQSNEIELFFIAIRTGNIDDFYKYYKEDFLEKEQFGRRPIHYASRQNQKEILQILLNKKCDINAGSSDNWRAIHYACRDKHSDVARLLIEQGCDIKLCDGDFLQPIHHVSRYGPSEIAELLIDRNCDIEAKDKNDWRPIHYASRNNQVEVAQLLVESNCDIEACTKPENWRPIHYACRYGYLKIMQILMGKQLNLEACTSKNWRPIHFACSYGFIDIVEELVERQINIESRTSDNMRPIHFACSKGHDEIARILINKDCKIESYNKENWHPIHFVCRYGYLKILKMLINEGCNLEVSTLDLMKPIHFACEYGYIDIAVLLVERNCQIDVRTKLNQSPLDFAIKIGNKELIDIIKEKLENPNMTNGHRLLSACQEGNLETVKLMIKRNCNINIWDENGRTPIYLACLQNNVEIIKILLENNCEIEIVDKFDRSLFSIVEEMKNEELSKIFKEEISFRKLVNEMASTMNVNCFPRCTHKLCSLSLHSKTFEKGKFIGKGKFGKVYHCQSSQMDREFAIKYIPTNLRHKELETKIMETVNNQLRKLSHERIVKLYGAFVKNHNLCIFMEFISRGTLQKKIDEKQFISSEKCAHYTRQLLEGLEYLHNNKLIHRDIKPGNILLDNDDNVKLVDLDLSRLLQRSSSYTSKADTVFGTAIFMAPEIFMGRKYTYSADIWSLGITIFTMITGMTPYYEYTAEIAMFKIANTRKIEFSEKSISKGLQDFMEEELLNFEPHRRSCAADLLRSKIFDLIITNIQLN